MVGNKKSLIISALAAVLIGTGSLSYAANSDLLKMDIQKSGETDTVNVVFYTTGDKTNTVVSRKGIDRYVVLLPNVSGNSSVIPSLGGVKEYISNVDVKKVDDGIGGYTKVTFTTTKPINIQTYVKKTLPLTKAQLDYKDLIAKNNAKPDIRLTKVTETKPAVQAAKTSEPKHSVQKTVNEVKPNNSQVKTQNDYKIAIKPTVNIQKTTSVQPKQTEQKTPEVKPSKETNVEKDTTNTVAVQTQPVISDVQETITKQEQEPKAVSSTEVKTQPETEKLAASGSSKMFISRVKHKISAIKKLSTKKKVGLGSLILLALLILVGKTSKKNTLQHKEHNNFSSDTNTKNTNKNMYQDIIDNNNLNWQEKYKLISDKNDSAENQNSYIAKVPTKKLNKNNGHNSVKLDYSADIDSRGLLSSNFGYRTHGIQMKSSNREIYQKQRLQDTISQMGHSIGDYFNFNDDSDNVISVDNSIMERFEEVKQKSFKLPKSLKLSDRHRLKEKKSTFGNSIKADIIKESNKYGLKKTKLTKERKNSQIVQLHQKKTVTPKKEAEYMDKDYSQASLQEYLSILDVEEKNIDNRIIYEIENKPRVTNPFNRPSMPKSLESISSMSGMVVKSKYSVGDNKEICLVNTDGVSAIVGKIGNDIRLLKKFDKEINTPLQVRHDEKDVYLVKTGKYKSLVDMSDKKMDLLLEI